MHGHVHLLYKLLRTYVVLLLLLFPAVRKYNYSNSCLKVGDVASIVATNHDAMAFFMHASFYLYDSFYKTFQ
jgi:hypothetical protein